ncbi:MAG: T9SS type A sorting domain-containing protein [Saprospiraceae bacterium]|nr:T9SS type A sorting domain-containing protein [Saprospiraceae bacterium]
MWIIDGDGDFDAISGSYYGDIHYFQNTGTATNAVFAAPVLSPFGMTAIMTNYAFPAFTDIDGDGDFDMFIGTYYGAMQYFENTGTATQPAFGTSIQNPYNIALNAPGTYLASPIFVDIDDDGDQDLFAGSYGTVGAILYQENTSVFVPNNVPTSADVTMMFNQDELYAFDAADFPFNDLNASQSLSKIKITALPSNGVMYYNNAVVQPNLQINANDLNNLIYQPQAGQYGTNFDNFQFQVSDGIDFSVAAYTFTFDVNALPTTVQTTVVIDPNTNYIFNVNDFTFNDPDGGSFQELEIVSLPTKGQVKLNGTNVTANQIIATSDFANLVYSPIANESGFPYTSFQFSVGDGAAFSQSVALIVNVNFPLNSNAIEGFEAVTLSPNPTSETVNLRIETAVSKSATLSVQNIAGQVVLNQNVELNGDFNAVINVRDWAKGVYIIVYRRLMEKFGQKN